MSTTTTDANEKEMSALRSSLDAVDRQLQQVAKDMERAQIRDYIELLNRPFKLIWRNFLSGTARGVGIAVGVTIFTATIMYVLRLLGALNLPIIGDYIADLVRVVQAQLDSNML